MTTLIRFFGICLLVAVFSSIQSYAQTIDLVLQDTTITTTTTFTAQNSITAGPDFTISNTGNVTFTSGAYITLDPGFTVITGGLFQAFPGASLGIETVANTDFLKIQNYPNPFSDYTEICFELTNSEYVSIMIFDIFGKKIRTLLSQNQLSGRQAVTWDGRNENGQKANCGIYFYRIETPVCSVTKKMLLAE